VHLETDDGLVRGHARGFSTRRGAIVASFAIAIATAPRARADEDQPKPDAKQEEPAIAFELAGDGVIVRATDEEKTVKVGCTARSFASSGSRAYVLCGASTVVTIDAKPEPHVVQRQHFTERFLSLTIVDGAVAARGPDGVKPLDRYTVDESPDVEATTAPPPRRRHVIRYGSASDARAAAPRLAPIEPPITGFEIDAKATGGIGVDNFVGVSSTLEAAFTYRFTAPLSIAAYGVLGAATGAFDNGIETTGPNGGDVQVAVGEILLSVDAAMFAIGAGVGVGMFERGYDVEPLVAARGRIGEIDGFDFRWHFSVATGGRTALGAAGGSMEFRLNRSWWLGAEAELGNLRYGRVMLDVRHRVIEKKNQKGPTVDLRAGIGLAYVETSSDCGSVDTQNTTLAANECLGTNTDYLGPAVSIGIVFRP